ncbi:transposase [Nocardia sp. NPDC057353]|uniref:transposase n=1 Tax=Nocardia sp. NPDC057353 TaxID=3346104 RepID=UPI003642FA2D
MRCHSDLVPDGFWALVEPLLPRFEARAQGAGTAPVDERALFTAAVLVLTSECAWRMLPVSHRCAVGTETPNDGAGEAQPAHMRHDLMFTCTDSSFWHRRMQRLIR